MIAGLLPDYLAGIWRKKNARKMRALSVIWFWLWLEKLDHTSK